MMRVLVPVAIVYVAFRIYTILPLKKGVKIAVLSVYGLAALAFILSVTSTSDHLPMWLARGAYIFGNSWLIFLAYAFIAFLLCDILILMRILPSKLLKRNAISSAVIFSLIAGGLTYGAVHYRHKYRAEMTVESAKISTPVKIVLASDLHAGYHNTYKDIRRWVDIINAEKPDLILLGGDLVDRSLRAVTADHDAGALRHFAAPVYSCLGNHEYYAGVEDAIAFYQAAGITVLKDSVVRACGLTIVGRNDAKNEERKPLHRLLRQVPGREFVLLLDHQPKDLVEAQLLGVDFQFSGHTHNGQIWPMSWIVRMTFEQSHGPMQKGATHYYISSGLGIWGGRFRIGSRSEYLVLNIVPATVPAIEQP